MSPPGAGAGAACRLLHGKRSGRIEMRRISLSLAVLLAAGTAFVPAVAKPRAAHAAAPAAAAADVAAAVSAPGRPEDQTKLDESRRPVEVLQFEGLRRGDIALDLFAGG